MDISGGWDLVVIGTGPAGEAAAMRAVKSGLRVAVVEDQERVGGSCTHLGTIPSKALRHQIRQVIRHHRNPLLQDMRAPVENRWERMVARARDAIDAQVSVRTGYYLRNRIPVFSGHGRLDGPGRVRLMTTAAGNGCWRAGTSCWPPGRGPIARRMWILAIRASTTAIPYLP